MIDILWTPPADRHTRIGEFLDEGPELSDDIPSTIATALRQQLLPRHVPDEFAVFRDSMW